jgi:divalent metal cation (Fe/Co/Zn/Cd) transporter
MPAGRAPRCAGRFTEGQIIGILKEAEVAGKTTDLCRRHGISERREPAEGGHTDRVMLDPPSDRAHLLRRGLHLELFTIAWMIIEAVVAIGAGWLAGSIALVAFGFDSLVELVSGGVLLYRLRAEAHGRTAGETEKLERRALWVVGGTFFLLTGYVLYEVAATFWRREAPDPSRVGIALAVAAVIVMPVLGLAKQKIGAQLNSRALVADAAETFVCAYLSLTLLLGLALNSWLGWWWADPVAALVMVPFLLHEGWEAIEEAREAHDA